jgi:6-methylsalicylate decarboxylase
MAEAQRIDVHQHLWPEPFLYALGRRRTPPQLVRDDRGWVLRLAGEPEALVDLAAHDAAHRGDELRAHGLERALLAPSTPLGVEALRRAEAETLLAAWHDGVFALGAPFGVWAAVALDDPDAADVEAALARGAVGLCLPAGALAGPGELERVGRLLECLERAGAPLFVHPGPASGPTAWWPALSGYVAQMHAAWLAWARWGRAAHPRLRVLFAFLAGLAPLQAERLAARGGPADAARDERVWLDTSSYGPVALDAVAPHLGRRPARLRQRPTSPAGGGAARGGRPGAGGGGTARRAGGGGRMTPAARDLGPEELQALVADLARRPELWAGDVRHDPGERVYVEILREAHVSVWLICWMEDHDTGFHDHDRSSGAVAVLDGAVREDRLALGAPPVSRVVRAGGTFAFGSADIHRVLHAGETPAVTLHAYSPPLGRMGAYEVRPDGVLVRHSIAPEEELRPLAGVASG